MSTLWGAFQIQGFIFVEKNDRINLVISMFMSLCETAEVLNVIRIIKTFITIIKIAVPILLIVSAMTAYLKAATSGDLQKSNKALLNKVLAGVIIFLVPTIVSVIINVAWPDSEVNQCLVNATSENIEKVRIEHTNDLIDRLENNFNIKINKQNIDKITSTKVVL